VVLKATKVDGVYTADPKKDPSATRYTTISFDEAISRNLQVMDATAFALCRDQKLPIGVFDQQAGCAQAYRAGRGRRYARPRKLPRMRASGVGSRPRRVTPGAARVLEGWRFGG
jgi:hypothetical protein